jgi:hypothetical protein
MATRLLGVENTADDAIQNNVRDGRSGSRALGFLNRAFSAHSTQTSHPGALPQARIDVAPSARVLVLARRSDPRYHCAAVGCVAVHPRDGALGIEASLPCAAQSSRKRFLQAMSAESGSSFVAWGDALGYVAPTDEALKARFN